MINKPVAWHGEYRYLQGVNYMAGNPRYDGDFQRSIAQI